MASRAEFDVPKETMERFILTLQANYFNNSFHSFNHALHVAQVRRRRRICLSLKRRVPPTGLPHTPSCLLTLCMHAWRRAFGTDCSASQVITLICKDYSFQRWFSFADQFWMVVAGAPLRRAVLQTAPLCFLDFFWF